MGDWHTLHLFDEKNFNDILMPSVQREDLRIWDIYNQTSIYLTKHKPTFGEMVYLFSRMENGYRNYPGYEENYMQHQQTFMSDKPWGYDLGMGLLSAVNLRERTIPAMEPFKLSTKQRWVDSGMGELFMGQ